MWSITRTSTGALRGSNLKPDFLMDSPIDEFNPRCASAAAETSRPQKRRRILESNT